MGSGNEYPKVFKFWGIKIMIEHKSKLDVVFWVVKDTNFKGQLVWQMIALDKNVWERNVSENIDEYDNKDYDAFWEAIWEAIYKHNFYSEGDYGEFCADDHTVTKEEIIKMFKDEGFYYSRKTEKEYQDEIDEDN